MKVSFLGQCMLDEHYVLDASSHYPQLGDKAIVNHTGTQIGGTTANTAAVATSLGIQATLIYELSNFEESTKQIVDDLKNNNISIAGIRYTDRQNPKCMIIHGSNGERAIYVLNNHITPPMHLSAEQQEIIHNSKYIYTNLYDFQLFMNKIDLCKEIKKRKINLFIDCDSNINKNEVKDLAFASIVSFNEFGYKQLNSLGYSAKDLVEVFDVKYVIITSGKNGSTLYTKDDMIYQQAFEVEVVDTTGAGDAYNAGFLYSLLSEFSLSSCLEFSAAVAAHVVSENGSRAILNVDEIIKRFNIII